jgi:hypothetical protein
MNALRFLGLIFLLISYCSVGQGSTKKFRMLFVGNSLTYTNELPKLISSLAKANGKSVHTDILAFPNYALQDHWKDGKVQTMIAGGNYDFVIIQQGPSSQADGRIMLIEYSTKLSKLCSQNKTQLVIFMVWPAIVNHKTFPGVIENYSNASKITNAVLCPVGQVWKDYIDSTNDYSYYGADGFHPSLKGSEVAAQVIYNTLFQNL